MSNGTICLSSVECLPWKVHNNELSMAAFFEPLSVPLLSELTHIFYSTLNVNLCQTLPYVQSSEIDWPNTDDKLILFFTCLIQAFNFYSYTEFRFPILWEIRQTRQFSTLVRNRIDTFETFPFLCVQFCSVFWRSLWGVNTFNRLQVIQGSLC